MQLYRIFTENKNYQDIIAQLQLRKIDATIINANGIWQGKAEKSIIIEIIDGNDIQTITDVQGLVYWIKKHNKQDKVLVQCLQVESKLV